MLKYFLLNFLFSLLSFLFIRSHMFMCLLSLEYMVVSLLVIYMNFYIYFSFGFYFLIFMMVMFVCEGVLGLSVLVSMIRYYGNDYLNSMMMW